MALADWTPPTKGVSPDFVSGFTLGLQNEVLRRMALGQSVRSICEIEGMPTPPTVYRHAERDASFGAAFRAARRKARQDRAQALVQRRANRPPKVKKRNCPGSVSTYSEARGEAVCIALVEGASLADLCRDPAMPSIATVYNWLHRYPEFARRYAIARRMQTEQLVDMANDLVERPVPVFAGRRRLKALRHRAAVLSPKVWAAEDRPPTLIINVTYVRAGEAFESPGDDAAMTGRGNLGYEA